MALKDLATRFAVLAVALFYGLLVVCVLVLRQLLQPTKPLWQVRKRTAPPAQLSDRALGDHRYAQLKNVKIHYVEKGDKSKPLILFVHGFPEFWFSWRHQIKEFAKDYWVVAMDMRGYGDSDKPDGVENYKLPLLVEDIKQLIQALGREKFTLVAHDWGGVVGWSFLFKHYDMVSNYVILDAPFPEAWLSMIFSDKYQFFKSWYMFLLQLPYLPELCLRMNDFEIFDLIFTPKGKKLVMEEVEPYKYTYGKPGAATAPFNYYRSLMQDPWHLPSPPKGASLPPGLFLFGEHEFALSFDLLSHAKDQIGVRTDIVKGAAHFVQQENPQEVNRLIREFLAREGGHK